MAKFRKKPVVIEAVQWTGDNLLDVSAFCPAAMVGAEGCVLIGTLEGTMIVSQADWIIKGVKGEFYPCKPDIFAATYESADDQLDTGAGFYLASFKSVRPGHPVLWWGSDNAGYTTDLQQAGIYTDLTPNYHDCEYTVPVPVAFIRKLRIRHEVDPGDSDNGMFWSAEKLRAAIAAEEKTNG